MGTSIKIVGVGVEGVKVVSLYRHYDGTLKVLQDIVLGLHDVRKHGLNDIVADLLREEYDETRRVYELIETRDRWGTDNTLEIIDSKHNRIGGVLFSWNGSEWLDAVGVCDLLISFAKDNIRMAKEYYPADVAHYKAELDVLKGLPERFESMLVMHALEAAA